MGFGFRVGIPGASVRVSTRGVRTSVGPRMARVNVGGGRTTVSSGMGPFFASTSLGGGRRSSSTRKTTRSRSIGPSPAQIERARRQAERAQQEAERAAAISRLNELRQQTTTVHLQSFTPTRPPVVPEPPHLGLPWALSEARAFHLQGVGRFARAERAAANRSAEQDAASYLAAEMARLQHLRHQLHNDANGWWQALLANDEATVCEAVNVAFSDNPAAGCAVGVDGAVLSIVLRQQDLDSLPDQMPALTPSGRPTLKQLSKRDRTLWWLTIMGSNVIASLKEAFATAPSITAIDMAVLSRMPDSQRLGIVAYGQWSRLAIENRAWRTAEDALRFLDLGEDVACSVRTTTSGSLSSTIKPLSTDQLPGLRALLDNSVDAGGAEGASLADVEAQFDRQPGAVQVEAPLTNPYSIRPFLTWKQETAPTPSAPPPAPPWGSGPRTPVIMAPGQTLVLPDEAHHGLGACFTFAGADADLTLLLTDADGRVTSDRDFVFYNQPSGAEGAVQLLGKHPEGPVMAERAAIHLSALPTHIHRVIVSINMDVEAGRMCDALGHAMLRLESSDGSAWAFNPPPDPRIQAMVVAEIYRHVVEGRPAWKLRANGQGWADGLDGLVRAYGVQVD